MDALSTLARAAHVLVLGAWAGAFALLARLPSALESVVPSRHAAGSMLLAASSHLEVAALWGVPILLLTLWAGWAGFGKSRRGRTVGILLLAIMTVATRFFVRPRFMDVRDGLGRPVEDLGATEPALAAYLSWEWTLTALVTLQIAVAVVLLVAALFQNRPRSSMGIQL